jgi:hypothetical protein
VSIRRIATLAAVAAAFAATPAHAMASPACATELVNAPVGGPSPYCDTGNTPDLPGTLTTRVARVEVLAGYVRATVTCGFGGNARSASIDVSGPQPQTVSLVETTDGYCAVSLTALAPNSTAVAVSTWTYRAIGPVQ